MRLLYGEARKAIRMSSTSSCIPEALYNLIKTKAQPYILEVEGSRISLSTNQRLQLACEVASAYHNGVCARYPDSDGFAEECRAMEKAANERLCSLDYTPSSSDASEPNSADDLQYLDEVYVF